MKVVKKRRPYLVGKPFSIKIDQQILKFLIEQRVGTLTEHKWITKLLGYSFVVEYKGRDVRLLMPYLEEWRVFLTTWFQFLLLI